MSRPLKRVSKKELRDLFNKRAYCDADQIANLEKKIERSKKIPQGLCQKLQMPLGSLSQIVSYRVPGQGKVALVHQYVRPDGSIRGKPDPKYLLIDGEIYALHLKPPASG